jgi:IS5 family transposase
MPPKSSPPDQPELFRSALVNLVDRRHPLVRLAGPIDWDRFRTAFGPLSRDGVGRPGLPTRLMVGLHLIKHMDGLSDAAVCARFLDSPYVQLFCGESHVQHALPLDRSSMARWRQRIGAAEAVRSAFATPLARIAQLRALLPAPRVIFDDAPTLRLDPLTLEGVMAALRSVVEETRAPLLLVTHDPVMAGKRRRLGGAQPEGGAAAGQ